MADVPVNDQVPSIVVDVVTNGQTVFGYDFRADAVDDLRAQYRPAVGDPIDMVGGVDFVASGLGTAAGGEITLVTFTETVSGATLAIFRQIPIERSTDYTRDLFAEDLNREQDEIYMIMQQLRRDVDRSLKVDIGDTPPPADYVFDQVEAALAAAAAAIGAANSQFSFATMADFLAANIPPVVEFVKVEGYYAPGDNGGHLQVKLAEAPGVVKPWHKQSADGAWWMLAADCVNPIMFGAVPCDGSAGNIVDSVDALEATADWLRTVRNVGEAYPGVYYHSRNVNFEPPFQLKGRGSLPAFETPFFDRTAMGLTKGAYFVGLGNGPRNLTLDYCSNQRFGGLGRLNPKRLYNNVHDEWWDAYDFTMGNAVGNKMADLKPFSAMVTIGLNGNSSKFCFDNIRCIPACFAGGEPLGGYYGAQASNYNPWDEWDFGIFVLNGYHSKMDDIGANGYFHSGIGLLQTSIRFGTAQTGGRGEALEINRADLNGYEVRQPDRIPILSKTANSITIPWWGSHRLRAPGEYGNPASARVFAETTAVDYTSLVHTPGAGGGTLTLGGIADTSFITIGETTLCLGNNNGTTQTELNSPRLRPFNHPSGVERPSPFYGAQASRYQAPISFIGWPIRGITIENETTYPNEAVGIVAFGGARDIKIWGGTQEIKSYRASGGGPLDPDGAAQAAILWGPEQASHSLWPALARGSLEVVSYALDGGFLLEPIYPSFGRRFSAYKDAFNPCIFDPGKIMGQNGKIYDARKPEQYRSSAVVAGAITAYDEFILVDTPSNADAACTIQTINAAGWINEVTLQRFNSGRTPTLIEGGNINLLGQPLTLFGGMSVTLVRRGGIWYLKNVFETRYIEGTLPYDPPSLADGAGADAFVTVTGAALGDLAVASFSLNVAGISVTANVVNANTVRVRFQNESGGVLDLGAGTVRARVYK